MKMKQPITQNTFCSQTDKLEIFFGQLIECIHVSQSSGNKGGRKKIKLIPIAIRKNPTSERKNEENGLMFMLVYMW